jgi:hypothetical protein
MRRHYLTLIAGMDFGFPLTARTPQSPTPEVRAITLPRSGGFFFFCRLIT